MAKVSASRSDSPRHAPGFYSVHDEIDNMGHFVPWNNPELIKDAVVRHIGGTE